MLKFSPMERAQLTGHLALLLVANAPLCAAQAADCTATVKIVAVGVPHPDDTRMPHRNMTLYRYKIDATSSEKQCAAIDFNLRRSYKLRDGSPFSAIEPKSIRIRGGKGSESGEHADNRGLPKIEWSADDINCRKC